MIMSEKRAEAPVVGTILLVAIVVVLSAIVSYGFLGTDFLGGLTATATPVVAVDVDASENGLALTQSAGTSLSTSELVLVVNSDGLSDRVQFTELGSSDGDGRFDAGDRYQYAAPLSGYADVMVVHEPSGTVLYRGTTILDGGSAVALPGIDLESAPIGPYNPPASAQPQDVSGDVVVDGNVITMEGNTWKAIEHPYTITANTVLTFEFRSSDMGEVHGVGLMDVTDFEPNQFYQVFGTQSWGQQSQTGQYSEGDDWVRYEVRVGEDFTGDVGHIVFATDCDTSSGCDGSAQSSFRNVQIYEAD